LALTGAGAVVGALLIGLLASLVSLAWLGALVGLAIGAGAVTWLVRHADERVLATIGAVPVPDGAEPRLRNLVDGLCVSNGLPVPHLSTVDDPGINCLSVGRSPAGTTLVITRGMLDTFDRMQLEGVVARQLAQVKSGETHLGTVVMPFAGVAPSLVAKAIPQRYDLLADLEGVGLTRYPPGLTTALERARGATRVASAPRASSHLWLGDPDPAGGEPAGIAHSPIDERIATLQEL
jgi:heat shock protein HtpX